MSVVYLDHTPKIKMFHAATRHIQKAADFLHDFWDNVDPPVSIPGPEIMIHCQKINPYTVVIVTDYRDKIHGVVESYAIRPKPMTDLLTSKLSESDLIIDDFFAYDQRPVWELYVAILCPSHKGETPWVHEKFTLACIAGSIYNIQRAYIDQQKKRTTVKLYSIDATDQGRSLMEGHLGFEVDEKLSQERRDSNNDENVWYKNMTRRTVNAYLKKARISPGKFIIETE